MTTLVISLLLNNPPKFVRVALGILVGFAPIGGLAQQRLKTMPGYGQHQRMKLETTNAFKSGALSVTWKDEGKAVEYQRDGKNYRYDIALRCLSEVGTNKSVTPPPRAEVRGRRERPPAPERGRQFGSAFSPDGKFNAFCRDRNLWLSDTNGTNEIALTTDGSERGRIKYGTASWVYGEELYQNTAMWWSSNSQRLAYYRFDESHVPDYYLQLNQTKLLSTADVEPYPKAGATNPVAELFVYDLHSKATARVDVRNGKPFDNAVVGHYVYGVSWSDDSRSLLFRRTNRRQNIMEFCAADPESGKCRVIVREEWPESWTENSPPIRFLKDGKRFIWTSARTGWRNLYLYNLSGRLLATLTGHACDVEDIALVDEAAGRVFYRAHDGDNPMKLQLHRVGLDGKGERRLTDPACYHNVNVAPDGSHFVDVAQTHDSPPATRLLDADGGLVAEFAQSDLSKFRKLGMRPVELIRFKAADGETELYGLLHFPSNFRPYKRYPVLVSVYAGPETTGAHETFTMPSLLTEYGFLVASFDSRSASGRGKRFLDAIYQKLGQAEIDDQAAGVRSLWDRRYVDRKRVGIFGTSYGGTASALCLLRYPEVFQAACSCSAVTDFRNYDTIYTERYLWLPQEAKEAYDRASMLTYADRLKGSLLVYYGTADNNVHPNNAMQFIQALQKAGKSFEVQVGPDHGHSGVGQERMMEFFIENLVQR